MKDPRPWFGSYDKAVPREIEVPEITLPGRLELTASRFGERDALVFMRRRMTYARLAERSAKFRRLLAEMGIKPTDRVALLFPNVPDQVACYYGAMMAGAAVVQVNPLAGKAEMVRAVRDSGAKILVGLDMLLAKFRDCLPGLQIQDVLVSRLAPWLTPAKRLGIRLKTLVGAIEVLPRSFGEDLEEALARVEPRADPALAEMDELALLQYTGGTTGVPKGAMLTQRNLVANTEQCRAWLQSTEDSRDVAILAVPFFHVYGMTVGMNLAVRNAQTMVLHPRFDAGAVMRSIEEERGTLFPGIQMFYQAINSHPGAGKRNLSSVRVCLSGAGPLMRSVQEGFEGLTGGKVSEGYGLTEASPVTHCNPLFGKRKIGCIGLPLPSTDARIVDAETGVHERAPGEEGELAVRGPQVMKGYWNSEEETARSIRDGWLFTGDIAVMDEEGYFRMVDRKNDMIKVGGESVYPRTVEEVLAANPAVEEAAVIGVPDLKYGERVKAFVVPKKGGNIAKEQLIAHCRSRLSRIQAPGEIEFRNSLPRNQLGKLLRRVLAEEERERRRATP